MYKRQPQDCSLDDEGFVTLLSGEVPDDLGHRRRVGIGDGEGVGAGHDRVGDGHGLLPECYPHEGVLGHVHLPAGAADGGPEGRDLGYVEPDVYKRQGL